MPGVPPDALAQVKRTLKSLFSRKKKNQDQTRPTSDVTTSVAPSATTPGEPTKTGTAPPPQPLNTLSQPQSQNPSQSAPAPPGPAIPAPAPAPKGTEDLNPKPEALPTKAQTLTPDTAPPLGSKEEASMSATSGPLDDLQMHGYSDEGKDKASLVGKKPGPADLPIS